ncbi:MAG: hypothetical protein ABW007_11240 [Chitinophagaceae bacterium]
MKTNLYKHLLYTWLLSHLLHPLMFFIDCRLVQSNQLFFSWTPASVFAFSGFGVLVSVPAAFISMFSLVILVRSELPARVAFITWLIVVPLSAAAAGAFVMKFVVGFFDPTVIGIFVPGMMAGIASVLMRYKQFAKLVRSVNDKSVPSYGQFYYGR